MHSLFYFTLTRSLFTSRTVSLNKVKVEVMVKVKFSITINMIKKLLGFAVTMPNITYITF